MAHKVQLDTSWVIDLPIIEDQFTFKRFITEDTDDGYTVSSSFIEYDATGSIQPYDKESSDIQIDTTLLGEKIVIFTKTMLSPGVEVDAIRNDADIVFWNNQHYRVIAREDWSKFGQGFFEVIAISTNFSGKNV